MKTPRILNLIGITLFAWLAWRERASLYQFAVIARQINPLWLLLVAGIQIIYYIPYSQIYKYSLRLFGFEATAKQLFPIGFVAMFVNSVVPAGGLAGVVPMRELAVRTNQSATRAALGYVFTGLAELLTILVLVSLTPIFIHYQAGVTAAQYDSAMSTLVLMIAILILIISLVLTESVFLGWMLRLTRTIANRLLRLNRQTELSEEWSNTVQQRLRHYLRQILRQPATLFWLFFYVMIAHALLLLTLGLVMAVFQVSLPLPALLVSYAVIMFTWFVSPTPQGIGFMEAAGAIALKSFGLTAAVALSVPVIFRVFVQWLPLLIGFTIVSHRRHHQS